MQKRTWAQMIVSGVLAGVVGFVLAFVTLSGLETPESSGGTEARWTSSGSSAVLASHDELPVSVPAGGDLMDAYQTAFRRVADQTIPVVVEVNVVNIVRQRRPTSPFEFFFGTPRDGSQEQEYRRPGLGSGVIVRRSGNDVFVLTNNHVAGEAEEIQITLADGRQFEAELVGGDARRDLALLKFQSSEDVPIARLGDSDSLRVGDWAFAVGNPLGFSSTVTAGIVSAIGRNPGPESGMPMLTDYIQTDAAINRGNSGGALVNLKGEVIGINTWIASQTGGNIGLGFAIPVNVAKRVVDDFIRDGRVTYGWLGISTGDAGPQLRSGMDLGSAEGAFVYNVFRGSPAEEGGILPGDFITRINGTRVSDSNSLVRTVADLQPNAESRFSIIRDGDEIEISLQTAIREDEAEVARRSSRMWPGLAVTPITDQIREELGLDRNAGSVIVGNVVQDGPAATAGVRAGDIINRVNNRNIESLADFYRALNDASSDEIMFRIRRGEQNILVGLVR